MAEQPPPWTTERPRTLIQVRSLDKEARKEAISSLDILRPDDHALLILAYEQTLREAEGETRQLREDRVFHLQTISRMADFVPLGEKGLRVLLRDLPKED